MSETGMSETGRDNGLGSADEEPVQGELSDSVALMGEFRMLRLVEALLFASAEPLSEKDLAKRLPPEAKVRRLLSTLADQYANRGVVLRQTGGVWAFRTAPDLALELAEEAPEQKRLSKAAVETLAVIAYHQPVTRAEIEEIRGVALSKGTLDTLLEAGWIKPLGRRQVPGRPLTWGSTDGFLDHFGLQALEDLPGIEELKAAGLLDARPSLAAYGARARDDGVLEDIADPDEEALLLAAEGGDGPDKTVQLDLLRREPADPESLEEADPEPQPSQEPSQEPNQENDSDSRDNG